MEKIYTEPHENVIYRNILSDETKKLSTFDKFNTDYKDIKCKMESYNKYPNYLVKIQDSTIGDFLSNINNDNGLYEQLVLYINDNNINNFDNNFKNLLYHILDDVNNKYNNIDDGFILKFRISKCPWIYTTHFDCDDGILLQLLNTRNIYTMKYDIEKFDDCHNTNYIELTEKFLNVNKVIIESGDILEIPKGLIHTACANNNNNNNNNNISIAVSIVLNEECYKLTKEEYIKYKIPFSKYIDNTYASNNECSNFDNTNVN